MPVFVLQHQATSVLLLPKWSVVRDLHSCSRLERPLSLLLDEQLIGWHGRIRTYIVLLNRERTCQLAHMPTCDTKGVWHTLVPCPRRNFYEEIALLTRKKMVQARGFEPLKTLRASRVTADSLCPLDANLHLKFGGHWCARITLCGVSIRCYTVSAKRPLCQQQKNFLRERSSTERESTRVRSLAATVSSTEVAADFPSVFRCA